MSTPQIHFVDLQAQRRRIRDRIDQAISRVLDHGNFIMGPQVCEFEEKLAEFCGVKHVVTCGNGTDALQLALMAHGVGAGDAVFVPSFTFASTAECVSLLGGAPVFVDVLHDTFNMDPASLDAAICWAEKEGLVPRAIIPVDLFGQSADYKAINEIAGENNLHVIADGAQSCGATFGGKRVGGLAHVTATSFFPSKPLGCYGDGGALMTDDNDFAGVLRSLRLHGKGSEKYDNTRIGVNSRLDTLQAAILIEKLAIFAEEIEARDRIARYYEDSLGDIVRTPKVMDGVRSAWAQYTILVDERDLVAEKLKAKGIPTAVYYPKPLHHQTAFKGFPFPGNLPVSEDLAEKVLSLPIHPYLDEEGMGIVTNALHQAIDKNKKQS